MTEGIIKGKNLRIFVDGLPIYHATECSFSSTMSTEKIATKDTDGKKIVASNYEWNLSSKGLVAMDVPNTHNSPRSLIELHKAGTPVAIQFRTSTGGDFVISGNAIIVSAQIGSATENSASFDCSFDGDGDFTIEDWNGENVPIITSAATVDGQSGVAFNYATVASNSPTSYALVGQLPAGLSFNTSTGAITGTPTGSANVRFVKIQAINGSGTGEQMLEINIAAA